jgi:ribonuclease BN (tRNA processing enzyme)
MKIHCLGTAGYHPNDQRQTSCYFVPEAGLILDAGTGLYRLPPLIQTDFLDIFLSHAHLDHVAGLTFLLDVLHQRPVDQVRIWGETAKLNAVRQHLFSEHIFPVQLDVEWREFTVGDSLQIGGGGKLQSCCLNHPGGSIAYRIDWPADHSLAYVTDTIGDVDAHYVQMITGCRLLMHECNFRDSAQQWAIKTGHTWTTRAAEVAVAAKVEQLVLTHINPIEPDDDPVDIEVAKRLFGNAQVAADGMVIEF